MIGSLRDHFVVPEVKELETLTPTALAPLDLFILCTTEGPALGGGARCAPSVGSQRRRAHHLGVCQLVGPWPLRGVYCQMARPAHQAAHAIHAADDAYTRPVDARGRANAAASGARAFGAPKRFVNKGESLFDVTPEAFEKGATQLVCSSGRRNLLADGVATLVWYPPNDSEQGVTGKGRVLVCSNFHWLCDRSHWMGGTFCSETDNQRLLLNFVAGAIADRIGVWRGDLD